MSTWQWREVESSDDVRIGVRSAGTGEPPLILVHGTGTDGRAWDSLAPLLASQRRVDVLDRRGRGGSGDSSHHSLGVEVGDLRAVMREVAATNGGTVDVFGHSFGAICALQAARSAPELRRLIVYEPPTSRGDELDGLPEMLAARAAEGAREEAVALFFARAVGLGSRPLAVWRRLPGWDRWVAVAETLGREVAVVREVDLDAANLQEVTAEVLVLVGGESGELAQANAISLASTLPDAQLEVLAGQGHHAVAEAPEDVAGRVARFLGTQTAAG